MRINQHTTFNLVIGDPLTHTKSPMLHSALYQHLGKNAVLLAYAHPSLSTLIDGIKAFHVPLTAVTMPFKEAVLPFLDGCSDTVQALGAANTIIQRNGRLYGENTDIDGIAYALRNLSLSGKNALIIGAGGAARAMGHYLSQQHCHLFWYNRTTETAMTLANRFGGRVIQATDLTTQPLDLIVNTTPIGMFPSISDTPLPHDVFQPTQTVFDMIYHPAETTLLLTAKQQGAQVISGQDMFIGQGLKQIEHWVGTSLLCSPHIELATQAIQHDG